MTAKIYAAFILQTGLEFNMAVWKIDPCYPFLFREEDIVDCLHQDISPNLEIMKVRPWIVTRGNFTDVIDDWNVRYFPTAESAQQALEEYKNIIRIENEKTRHSEYDNWIAERSSWQV